MWKTQLLACVTFDWFSDALNFEILGNFTTKIALKGSKDLKNCYTSIFKLSLCCLSQLYCHWPFSLTWEFEYKWEKNKNFAKLHNFRLGNFLVFNFIFLLLFQKFWIPCASSFLELVWLTRIDYVLSNYSSAYGQWWFYEQ